MPEVHVFMAEGRTDAQKRGMMQAVTKALVDNLDCPADAVTVQIIEAKWTEKMKGGNTFAERYADKTPVGYRAARPKGVM
jgi:4-oxalocrotonate tautomerase